MGETRTEAVAPVTGRRLWMGLWLAPLAWAVAGLAGYMLVARSCEPGPNGLHLHGVEHPAVVSSLVVSLLGVAALWALRLSYGAWQRIEDTAPPDDTRLEREAGAREPRAHGLSPAYGRAQFVSFAGLVVSSLLILGLVYFIVPAFLLNPCVQSH